MSGLISPHASVYSFEGHFPEIAPDVLVLDGSRLSGKLTIGAGSSIWYNCVARGDVNSITIGTDTNIQDGSVLHVTDPMPLVIGNKVVAGHGVILHACTIHDGVLVGMGAKVLDGAVIGEGCIIAAGSIVTPGKIFEPGQMLVGSPAKPVRPVRPEEKQLTLALAEKYKLTAQRTAKSLGWLPTPMPEIQRSKP